ncbi:winged helix-turn-helix transcriptional regulator [Streptomyces umbrinus]
MTCPEVPPRAEYALTELGHTLGQVVHAMHAWAAAFARQHRE